MKKATWQPSSLEAETILQEAAAFFGGRAALSCSFGGPGGMVLVHMASRLNLRLPVIFLDTDFLFPETLALKETIAERYALEILTFKPSLTPAEQAEQYGERLWEQNPDQCCGIRKVEPMQRALDSLGLDAWITALRRDQSDTRRHIGAVTTQQTPSGRTIWKIHPLVTWTRQDVWRYIHQHDVPYNPLLDEGYSSLGCTHCTAKANGEGERAGRWPGKGKTECGLHTF